MRSLGFFLGFEWKERGTCLALGFETGKMREKEGNSQVGPLYKVERKNSLAVRLQPFAINGLDCPRVSTAEIRRPLKSETNG